MKASVTVPKQVKTASHELLYYKFYAFGLDWYEYRTNESSLPLSCMMKNTRKSFDFKIKIIFKAIFIDSSIIGIPVPQMTFI